MFSIFLVKYFNWGNWGNHYKI